MYGKLFQTVDSLQIHLLSNHSLHSEAVLQVVKKQEGNISEIQLFIKKISASQINILDEIKDMTSTLMKGHVSVAPPLLPPMSLSLPPSPPFLLSSPRLPPMLRQPRPRQPREQEQKAPHKYCQSLPGYCMSATR